MYFFNKNYIFLFYVFRRSTRRHGGGRAKEKGLSRCFYYSFRFYLCLIVGLENVTDSEEQFDTNHNEPVIPKQSEFFQSPLLFHSDLYVYVFIAALEAYLAMDWTSLSRDKRIPLNSQTTSRIARFNDSTRQNNNSNNLINGLGITDRLLTNEQNSIFDYHH